MIQTTETKYCACGAKIIKHRYKLKGVNYSMTERECFCHLKFFHETNNKKK